MMASRAFTVEIQQRAPTRLGDVEAEPPIDITDRLQIEGLGAINRAIERDLLSFKTGDVTLVLDNSDGYFDDLFRFMVPTTQWMLTIRRGPVMQFLGIIIAKGSITFNRSARNVEITAYGASKVLDITSAESVKRTLAVTKLGAAVTAGATTLTLDSTTGLLTGDVLHITDHVNKEDVTVQRVSSTTIVALEAAVVNSYAINSPVECTTPYYRYESIETLVGLLFAAAGIPMVELLMSNSQFDRLAPTPINYSGWPTTVPSFCWDAPCQKLDGYITVGITSGFAAGAVQNDRMQASPDADWENDPDVLGKPTIDWSRCFTQANGDTGVRLLIHWGSVLVAEEAHPANMGWEYVIDGSGDQYSYYYRRSTNQIYSKRSTGGSSWFAEVSIGTFPVAGSPGAETGYGVEFDPVRRCLYVYKNAGDTTLYAYHFDLGSSTWTNLAQPDDTGTESYFGFRYVPEKDYTLCLRVTNQKGPTAQVAAFRGTTRLWVKSFPAFLAKSEGTGEIIQYPTMTIRYVNGALYGLVVHDGALQFLYTDDDFDTYTMKKISDQGICRYQGARVNNWYYAFGYSGSVPRLMVAAAPFYSGVVDYADYTGSSVAEALGDLALITNGVYWVDEWLQGHFVARDLLPAGDIVALDDVLMEQNSGLLWDESAQYVKVAGPSSIEATAGDTNYASEGIDLNSDLVPNEAFAHQLAMAYFEFYSQQRAADDVVVAVTGTEIYRPLQRVTIGARRYVVYESDHDLVADEATLSLLEDSA